MDTFIETSAFSLWGRLGPLLLKVHRNFSPNFHMISFHSIYLQDSSSFEPMNLELNRLTSPLKSERVRNGEGIQQTEDSSSTLETQPIVAVVF